MEQHNLLAPRGRLVLAALGLLAAVLLATAWRLTPDRRGYGTHEQLGMAPCWFMRWTGKPCPTCGMTTAWSHAVRGDVAAALAANAGGAISSVLAMAGAPWAVATALAGGRLGRLPSPRVVLWIGATALAVTLLDWARRLTAG